MSPDVARFLLALLEQQQVKVGAEDFDETIRMIQRAKAELIAYLAIEQVEGNDSVRT